MTQADIVKEMADCIGQVTDFGHVVDTVLRERRYQASKRKFQQEQRAYWYAKKAKQVSL